MKSIKLTAPERIQGAVLGRTDLTHEDKRLYSQIAYSQDGSGAAELYLSWLSDRLRLARSTICKSIKRLEAKGLLKVKRRHRHKSSYSITVLNRKKFFLILGIEVSRHNVSIQFVYNYLKFRQGENNRSWPHQTTIAKDLGMSRRSVQLILKHLETEGYIRVEHAHGGLKQGSKYTVTNKMTVEYAEYCAAELRTRAESGAQNVDPNDKQSLEVKKINTEISKTSGLSRQAGEASRLLIKHARVNVAVAREIAAQHSLETIKNAIINAIAQGGRIHARGKAFRLSGYVIATLNRAKQEGHSVKLNSYAAKQKELWKNLSSRDQLQKITQDKQVAALRELAARKQAIKNGTAKPNVPAAMKRILGVA